MKIKNLLGMGLILGLSGIMYGCGDDAKPAATGPEGTVLQGPVSGATVVAKKTGNTDFSQVQTGEDSATTDSTGKFKFQSTPTYAYTLVALPNGKDTLTNKTNIPLVAKAGSTYVTPLTTLVATDTTGTVEAKLLALAGGTATSIGDVNISTTTPAALVVVKAVETAAAAMAETVTKAAGTASIQSAQLASVQARTFEYIAAEIAKPATTVANLSTPAALTTILNNSITAVIPKVTADNSNIVITAGNIATVATAIADVAVDQSAKAILGATSGKADATAASTATTVVESEKINTTTAATIATATTAAATTASAATTVTATPSTYTPPVVKTALTPAVVSSTLAVSASGVATLTVNFNHALDSSSVFSETNSSSIKVGTAELDGTLSINSTYDTITFTASSLPAAGAVLSISLADFLPLLSTTEQANHFAAAMPKFTWTQTVPSYTTGTTGTSGTAGSSSQNF